MFKQISQFYGICLFNGYLRMSKKNTKIIWQQINSIKQVLTIIGYEFSMYWMSNGNFISLEWSGN